MAFISGLLIYGGAVVLANILFDFGLVDMLALSLDGRTNARIAVAGTASIINFMLAFAWAYSVVRVPVGGRRPLTPWCLSGVGMAWLIGTLGGVFHMVLNRGDQTLFVSDVLLSPRAAPFWGPYNVLAVVTAVTLAGVWALRTAPPSRRRSSALA